MATIPQQLLAIAEAAKKAGAKTGRDTAEYTRKHAPALAKDYISHLHLAHHMLRKPQYAPAIEAARKGAAGTLAQLAKPYKADPVPRGTKGARPPQAARAAGKGADGLDARLARALGLDAPAAAAPRKRRRTNDPAPIIADAVFQQMVETARASIKKTSKRG